MTLSKPQASHPFGAALAVAVLTALAAIALWPALGAGFIQDDWDFLASSAQLPTPLPYFLENYSRGYAYRPNGMLVWWLANRSFGLVPAWHYALQILVHAACALALLRLMRGLGATRTAALAAAAIFVVHPATVATSLWLSNRFDLLAALGLLACLRLLLSPGLGRPAALAGVAACAWLAVGAKEIGVLVVPLAAVAIWLRPDASRRDRIAAGAAVLVPTLAWFALRLSLMGDDDITTQRDFGMLLGQFRAGVGLWWYFLPQAVALDAPTWLGALILSGLAVAAFASMVRGTAATARRAWLGLALLVLPPLLQWPITHFALATPDALSASANLRFYFLSLCGATVLLSIMIDAALSGGTPSPGTHARRVVVTIAAAALLWPLGNLAQRRGQAWVADTANPQAMQMQTSLVDIFMARAGGAGCKLVFAGPASANLPGFADHIAKAHLPRGHRALDSLVVTDPMPWSAIVGPAGAQAEALRPLPNRFSGPVELLPAPVGPLFYVSPEYRSLSADDPGGCPPLFFRWDGTKYAESAPIAQ